MYAKQITFRLDPALLERLEKTARKQMRSVSGMLRMIVAENIVKYESAGDAHHTQSPKVVRLKGENR